MPVFKDIPNLYLPNASFLSLHSTTIFVFLYDGHIEHSQPTPKG